METRVTKLLGIEYPIIQGGMAWVANANLAANVSKAGGIGFIGAANAPGEWVRSEIRKAREITDKPVGVNIMLLSEHIDEVAQVVVEEKVSVVSTGAGNPGKYMKMWKDAGIKVMPVVASVALAKLMERAGADMVIAEGMESGGHIGEQTTMTLVPQVADAVSIPVMAKARIGHIAEAQILETLGVDMIDESEVLTPADEEYHLNKKEFTIPFVCGARNLGEALRRIDEGAAMIRTKGEPGTGNIVEAVRHMRMVLGEIRTIQGLDEEELWKYARKIEAPIDLVKETAQLGKLPVVNFAAGGIATPADASLMMQLGSDGIFVGSGIFKSNNPEAFAKAIVEATANYDKPEVLAEVSKGLGEAMKGLEMSTLSEADRMQDRGI